jgi:hypothetical protein
MIMFVGCAMHVQGFYARDPGVQRVIEDKLSVLMDLANATVEGEPDETLQREFSSTFSSVDRDAVASLAQDLRCWGCALLCTEASYKEVDTMLIYGPSSGSQVMVVTDAVIPVFTAHELRERCKAMGVPLQEEDMFCTVNRWNLMIKHFTAAALLDSLLLSRAD